MDRLELQKLQGMLSTLHLPKAGGDDKAIDGGSHPKGAEEVPDGADSSFIGGRSE